MIRHEAPTPGSRRNAHSATLYAHVKVRPVTLAERPTATGPDRPSGDGNGRAPRSGSRYNLAERILGDIQLTSEPFEDQFDTPAADHDDTDYNLASNIYGDTAQRETARNGNHRNGTGNGSNGNGAGPYNLAARIYAGNGNAVAAAVAQPLVAQPSAAGAPPRARAPIAVTAPSRRRWRLPRTFEALEFGPFRWYMGAMIWWNGAMSMQMLVRGYLAYHLTGDFRALGLVSIGSALPMLLLSPLGGVIADRTSRRAVLQVGQTFSLAIAVVVAVLLFSGMLDFWHLVAASVAQGIMMALVMPSRQAFLPEVVGMGRLMNAIPLQSAGMNLMQLIAPAIGGFMIDLIGAGSVYSVMAVMYAFSVVALFGVRSMSAEDLEASRSELGAEAGARSGARSGAPRGSALSELAGGLRYIVRDRTILAIVSLSFLTSILAMPIRMLLPGYVAEVFDDSGATLGLLQASMAIGALIGALVLATMRTRQRRGLLFAGSAVLMGVAMLGFSTTGTFIAGATGLFVIGIGSAGRQSMSQLLVQEYVHDEYRGRVMAVFMMQFSLMSVGVLGVAIMMQALGAQIAIMVLGGLLVAATFLYLLLVPRLRRLA